MEGHTVGSVSRAKFPLIGEGIGCGSPKIQNVECVVILPVLERLGIAYDF